MHTHNKSIGKVSTAAASVPFFIFVIIAGAVACPLSIQIYYCHHFGFIIALRENNSDPLVIFGNAFQRVPWATGILDVTFFVINSPVLHDLFYLGL
jgi:hypothetical protein